MNYQKKKITRREFLELSGLALVATACGNSIASLEAPTVTPSQSPTLTDTPMPPTSTPTENPTETPTPTSTPEMPPPVVSEFVRTLPGEFSISKNREANLWELKEHLTIQNTETETEVIDVDVAKFNSDGTQMVINVKGEEKRFPVTSFGLTPNPELPETQETRLAPGSEIKDGIGYKLGLKEGEVDKFAYNGWGKWVKNEDYPVGNLVVNDYEMFAGAIGINPEKADYIYEGFLGGLYEIQQVSENRGFLSRFPTRELFISSARDGYVFNGINVPDDYPVKHTPQNFLGRLATIVPTDNLKLDTIRLGFMEQTREEIMHPQRPLEFYDSFFSYHLDGANGSLASVAVETYNGESGNSELSYTFARPKIIFPYNYYNVFLVESPKNWIVGAANQILEAWIYAGNNLMEYERPFIKYYDREYCYPILNLYAPMLDDAAMGANYPQWAQSDLIRFNND